ncbi:MAG: hypothetical protein M3N50_01730 [Pseudomonadota bacterium]|nr:hypothetical protein [Pseudomonadota bacterium]
MRGLLWSGFFVVSVAAGCAFIKGPSTRATPAAAEPRPIPAPATEINPPSPATSAAQPPATVMTAEPHVQPKAAGHNPPAKAANAATATKPKAPAGTATASVGQKAAAAPAAPAAQAVGAAPAPPPPSPRTLNLADLEQRLRDTKAIGVFTKLSLKNQVDDLLNEFRTLYKGPNKRPSTALRQHYDLLLLKVLSLLQDSDPPLAAAISSSREAIWGILADPDKFAKI